MTWPDELALTRARCPDLSILLPGIGARGGDLKAIRSMELWAERVVPMVEQALGMSIGEIEGAPPWPSTP